MKSRSSKCAMAMILLCAGCVTKPVEYYPDIPDYPENASYEMGASCFVPSMLGQEYMSGLLSSELKKCGYNIYGNDAFDRKTPCPPDFVVEALRWHATMGCHNGDNVVYVQVIVRVRRPAVLTADKHRAVFGDKPRDFQAISRRIIGKRGSTVDDYNRGIADAMSNMMRNPAFRKALENKDGWTPSAAAGFDMTVEKLPTKPVKQTRK